MSNTYGFEERLGADRGSRLGARLGIERKRTAPNRSQHTYADLPESQSRRSAHFLIYVDTVGVTGSIPVSPTSYIRWSDGLSVITTGRPFLRRGSKLGATDLDHTYVPVVVTRIRAPILLPPPLQPVEHRGDHGWGDVGVDPGHTLLTVPHAAVPQHVRDVVLDQPRVVYVTQVMEVQAGCDRLPATLDVAGDGGQPDPASEVRPSMR